MVPLAIKKKQNIFGDKGHRLILSMRGMLASIGIICFFSAVRLINPSDAVALFNCCIIFIAVLARILLKEKLTIVHLISLCVTMIGILLITQPKILFLSLQSTKTSNASDILDMTFNVKDYTLWGCILALSGALSFAFVNVILKYLAIKKAHLSVVLLYATYYGIPTSVLTCLVMILTGLEERKDFSIIESQVLKNDFYLAIVAGLISVLSQILINLAIQLEDASKVSIIKSTDLIFTFFFQYICLGIQQNFFSLLGASCIFLSALMLVLYKRADSKHTKRLKKISENNLSVIKKKSCFNEIIFYKF
jgi:drug/metabolite transporter (DMT)-like permease